MGLHFEQGYYNTVPHFREFGGKKILVSRDLKMGLNPSFMENEMFYRKGLVCFFNSCIIQRRLERKIMIGITLI